MSQTISTLKPKRAVKTSKPTLRIHNQAAFVLHSTPWRETSLVLDVFTRDYGRIAMVAKGAKRPASPLRGVLQSFVPLAVSFSGKAEVRTLTGCEWVGGMAALHGRGLMCGYYLNELMQKLLPREDSHPALFDHYLATLAQLSSGAPDAHLRAFERVLLKEAGLAANWAWCAESNAAVQADGLYAFQPNIGMRPWFEGAPCPPIAGQTLLDLENDAYQNPLTQAQSKSLMRFALNYFLDGKPLVSRQIMTQLSQLN